MLKVTQGMGKKAKTLLAISFVIAEVCFWRALPAFNPPPTSLHKP